MINNFFKNKYQFLSEYFENYFKIDKRFPQSIVFEGRDILSQYFFALELARNVNCLNSKEEDCACLNCKWIKEGSHPSVIRITPVNFKDDNTKTVISVKQAEKITSMISETSDYHRFFIFSDAKITPYNKFVENKIQKYANIGYTIAEENWCPYPLNRKILQEEASNALLKSIEEAPDKVTFIFLTNTKEDIIQTITSRSLIFKMPSINEKAQIPLEEFFIGYPFLDIENAINLPNKLIEYAQNLNIDLISMLDCMQDFLLDLLKNNLNLKEIILEDIKKIQIAKKHINALVVPKHALENLFISMSKEGRL